MVILLGKPQEGSLLLLSVHSTTAFLESVGREFDPGYLKSFGRAFKPRSLYDHICLLDVKD